MEIWRAVAPLLVWAALGWAALTLTLWLVLLGVMALQRLSLLHPPDAEPSLASDETRKAA
jgi:hypothetical protein